MTLFLLLATGSILIGFAAGLVLVRFESIIILGLMLAVAAAIILAKSSFSLGPSISLAVGVFYIYQIGFVLGQLPQIFQAVPLLSAMWRKPPVPRGGRPA